MGIWGCICVAIIVTYIRHHIVPCIYQVKDLLLLPSGLRRLFPLRERSLETTMLCVSPNSG